MTNEHLESVDVLGERHAGQSRGVVPHGEAAAKEWTSLKAQRVEGWRWNGCLVALLNGSELKFTYCVIALEGQVERVSWEEWRKAMTTM